MDLTTPLKNCSSTSNFFRDLGNEIRRAAEDQIKQLRISNPVL